MLALLYSFGKGSVSLRKKDDKKYPNDIRGNEHRRDVHKFGKRKTRNHAFEGVVSLFYDISISILIFLYIR